MMKSLVDKVIIDMPNKALNDAVKGEVKGVLESTLETNPRVPEDSILGMAITMKRLSEEIKNGKA